MKIASVGDRAAATTPGEAAGRPSRSRACGEWDPASTRRNEWPVSRNVLRLLATLGVVRRGRHRPEASGRGRSPGWWTVGET